MQQVDRCYLQRRRVATAEYTEADWRVQERRQRQTTKCEFPIKNTSKLFLLHVAHWCTKYVAEAKIWLLPAEDWTNEKEIFKNFTIACVSLDTRNEDTSGVPPGSIFGWLFWNLGTICTFCRRKEGEGNVSGVSRNLGNESQVKIRKSLQLRAFRCKEVNLKGCVQINNNSSRFQ